MDEEVLNKILLDEYEKTFNFPAADLPKNEKAVLKAIVKIALGFDDDPTSFFFEKLAHALTAAVERIDAADGVFAKRICYERADSVNSGR